METQRFHRCPNDGQHIIHSGVRTFVEIGPGNVLSGLLKRMDRSVQAVSVSDLTGLAKLEEVLAAG